MAYFIGLDQTQHSVIAEIMTTGLLTWQLTWGNEVLMFSSHGNVGILAHIVVWYIVTDVGDTIRISCHQHCNDDITGAIASQIISLTFVYSTVNSGADQTKHQSSASLAFARGIHRGLVNYLHKGPETRNMFPFDDVIMNIQASIYCKISWVPRKWQDNTSNIKLNGLRLTPKHILMQIVLPLVGELAYNLSSDYGGRLSANRIWCDITTRRQHSMRLQINTLPFISNFVSYHGNSAWHKSAWWVSFRY